MEGLGPAIGVYMVRYMDKHIVSCRGSWCTHFNILADFLNIVLTYNGIYLIAFKLSEVWNL
jgi:hypothetical protein